MSHILFVIPCMSSVGGAEKLVITLSALLKHKHNISIASFDQIGAHTAFPTTCNFYPLGECSSLPLPLRLISYLQASIKLFNLKRRLDANLSISILWRADLINALTKRKSEKIASLVVINIANNPTNALMVKLQTIVGRVYRRFDKILAITPKISNEIKSLYRIKADQISVFRTFVDPQRISESLAANNRQRFVFCGRAVHEKNIEGVLHVFKLFSSTHRNRQLVVIGDGPLLPSMITLAEGLGLSVSNNADSGAQVVFVGGIKEPELYMQEALAFLLTSKHEGLPTVLIQAAALGLPILASDCQGGGVQYLLNQCLNDTHPKDKLSGILLPIPDPLDPISLDAWVRAMELIDSDETYRKRMISLSNQISHRYSKEAVRDEWLALITAISSQ